MTTLENAAAVLKLFSQQRVMHGQPGIAFSDVVEQLALPKSTVSRLLQTMENQGMLERDPDLVTAAAKRTEIAVLFTDLAGFTALIERLAPEAIGEFANNRRCKKLSDRVGRK